MSMSEPDLRRLLDERSAPDDERTARRAGRLAEVHTAIGRSRRRRAAAGAVFGTGALVAAVIAGSAVLSWPDPTGTQPGNAGIEPAGAAGGDDSGDGDGAGDDSEPFTVRLDDFADAEALVERLADHGIDAEAVDAMLDPTDSAAVLGEIGSASMLVPRTGIDETGAEFTFEPDAIAGGRIVVAMGIVGDPEAGEAATRRPIVVYEQTIDTVDGDACDAAAEPDRADEPDIRGDSGSGTERLLHVHFEGDVLPWPVCIDDHDSDNGGDDAGR